MKAIATIFQSEASECGLACLAMISGFYGVPRTLASLRAEFQPSLRGVSLAGIMNVARAMNFSCRAIRTEPALLKGVKLPAVLHWDMNHFVVLEKLSARGGILHDPKIGRREVSKQELSERFTGVVLEFSGIETGSSDSAVLRPEIEQSSVFKWLGRFRGFGKDLAVVIAISVALEIAVLLTPSYLQTVVDTALASGDVDLVTTLGIAFSALTILQFSLIFARANVMSEMSFRLHHHWAGKLFRHLVLLPAEYFQKRHVGDVVSRFRAIDKIQRAVSATGIEVTLDAAMSLLLMLVMFNYSASLTLVSLAFIVAVSLARITSLSFMRRHSEAQAVASAREMSGLLETVRNSVVIKILGIEQRRLTSWTNAYVDSINGNARVQRLSVLSTSLTTFLFSFEQVVVIWVGSRMVLNSSLSVGMLLAFLAYRAILVMRVRAVLEAVVEFRLLSVDCERLHDLTSQRPGGTLDTPVKPAVPLGAVAVEFVDVSFRYSAVEPWILRNVNFRIEAGESVALVGPSGCGKSTISKLVLGLLKPTQGTILLNARPLESFDRQSLCRLATAVLQEDGLFAGTLFENISAFDESASMEDVQAAAASADIHDDIAAMPMQYETLVGDTSSSLSGGQRQRVLLARALYRKASILVLDEATSHLDVASEQRVNSAIQKVDCTRILIAHRAETIASAHRTIALDNPRAVAKAAASAGRNVGVIAA